MNKFAFAFVGAASLALAACGGKGDDALADNVEDNYEANADNMDAMAANTADPAAAANIANAADATREAGDEAGDAIDAADVNAAGVNAM